jgi:tetratricopeptide (TPR) repeat protein
VAQEADRIHYGLIAAILLIGGGLWSADLFLATTERREVRAEARHYYERGADLLHHGQPAQAIDPLRKAYAEQRTNRAFSVALATALVETGKRDEAARILTDLLARSPNDGESNLLEARLALAHADNDGAIAEAQSYYHRAIFGNWPDLSPEQAQARKIEARMELAAMLAARGMKQELLSELLELEPETAGDISAAKKVAAWYLVAGSPQRAAEAYKKLVGEDPEDASNASGLGRAELALGNYRAAESAFTRAGDPEQANLAETMASLDPTIRTLSSAEKLRRSERILALVRDTLARCNADPQTVAKAQQMLDRKVRGPVTNEIAEERLSLAEDLWKSRPPACDDIVVRQMMQKLE